MYDVREAADAREWRKNWQHMVDAASAAQKREEPPQVNEPKRESLPWPWAVKP